MARTYSHLKVTADPAATSATTDVPESPPMPQFISLLEPGTVCVAHQHRMIYRPFTPLTGTIILDLAYNTLGYRILITTGR